MNKNLIFSLLAAVYVIRHTPTQDIYMKFDGLTTNQISSMYQKDGVSFNFIDEKVYLDFIKAQAAIPVPVDPGVAIRNQAVLDAKNTGLTTAQRLDALIKATLP